MREVIFLFYLLETKTSGSAAVVTPPPGYKPYRHLKTLTGHTGGVSCVKFSNEGTLLASASLDKTLIIWSSAATLSPLSMADPSRSTLSTADPSPSAASAVGSPRRQAGAVRRSHPPQRDAGLSEWEVFCYIMAAVAASGVVLVVLPLVAAFLIGPSYPTLKVTGLMVSNATWEATLLAERLGIRGTYLFKQVECFLYYSWDAARPFAVGSVEPLVLRTPGSIVIEATMRTEEEEEEAEAEGSLIRKMILERRSRGMVVVGLGLRMLGTTEFGPWFKETTCLLKHAVTT